MKKPWEELLEEIEKLERYKNYLDNSEEKADIYYNKIQVEKLKNSIREKFNDLINN